MTSDDKEKRAKWKRDNRDAKYGGGKKRASQPPPTPTPTPPPSAAAEAAHANVVTSGDTHFKIERLCLKVEGHVLLENTSVEFHKNKRYGLVGPNGSGKSTLLEAIGSSIPIPHHMTFHSVADAVKESDLSVLEAVMGDKHKIEKNRVEREIANLKLEDDKESLYAALDAIGPKATHRACEILAGFGFNSYMLQKKTRDFKESWRMRIALARALFVSPDVLVLKNPTKHLDFEACAWLEERLGQLENMQIIESNSQSFLSKVCTDILEINIHEKTIVEHCGTGYNEYLRGKGQEKQNQIQVQIATTNRQCATKFSFTDVAAGVAKGTSLFHCKNVEYGYSG